MIHPDTELRKVNDLIGYGVFATMFIPKGTITWVRDDLDQVFAASQIERMDEVYRRILEKYTFVDAAGDFILCWDHSRFVNHSCEANCLSAGYDFEFAVRDIQPEEELTDDYGTLNLREPFQCACGARHCRKQISPDDMDRFGSVWDRQARLVFPIIPSVPQPLWPLVKEKAAVAVAHQNPARLRSIRCNYFPIRKDVSVTQT